MKMSEKVLTVAIPAYNAAAYIERCVSSLLDGGDRIEILIIDDGSRDETGDIADSLSEEHPGQIRTVHQENGGHGEAINTGIREASGTYFKVVDSDDWLDGQVLCGILDLLEKLGDSADMLVTNFIYDKQGVRHKKTMEYRRYMPENRLFFWEDMKPIPLGRYLLMHALIYRTAVLRRSGLQLPAHTFYVDNIYAFDPFPYVNQLYYLDRTLYHYYIGREDQSVNEKVMISRLDQQLQVNRLMVRSFLKYFRDTHHENGLENLQDNNDNNNRSPLRRYMFNYLTIITAISSVMALRSGSEENLQKKEQLWQYIRQEDEQLYREIRHSLLGRAVNLPGKAGRKITTAGYKAAQKIYGFN